MFLNRINHWWIRRLTLDDATYFLESEQALWSVLNNRMSITAVQIELRDAACIRRNGPIFELSIIDQLWQIDWPVEHEFNIVHELEFHQLCQSLGYAVLAFDQQQQRRLRVQGEHLNLLLQVLIRHFLPNVIRPVFICSNMNYEQRSAA